MNREILAAVIEKICPSETAESWDNCGFQLDMGSAGINTVLVSLEVTGAVIEEAAACGAQMILTHHPLLFSGIKKIEQTDVIGNYLIRLIQAGISVYSCHTSFDKLKDGNNDYFGLLLEFQDVRPFDADNGFCRRGQTPFDMTFAEMIRKVSEELAVEERYFKWVGDLTRQIKTVSWCTGAGSEFILDAKKEGCDLYITGDLKYHEAQMAKESGICVLDIGHYGSEKIFTGNMADMLREATFGTDLEVLESQLDLNPFGCA